MDDGFIAWLKVAVTIILAQAINNHHPHNRDHSRQPGLTHSVTGGEAPYPVTRQLVAKHVPRCAGNRGCLSHIQHETVGWRKDCRVVGCIVCNLSRDWGRDGPVSVKVVALMVDGFIALLNVAVTAALAHVPVAPLAGITEFTVDGYARVIAGTVWITTSGSENKQ